MKTFTKEFSNSANRANLRCVFTAYVENGRVNVIGLFSIIPGHLPGGYLNKDNAWMPKPEFSFRESFNTMSDAKAYCDAVKREHGLTTLTFESSTN